MVSQDHGVDAGLKAVADATRRAILDLLKGRQLSVLEIAEEFPMSRPAISKHLRILKEAGLVLEVPSGRQRLYSLETAPLARLSGWLAGFNGSGAPGRWRSPGKSRTIGPRAAANDWRVW